MKEAIHVWVVGQLNDGHPSPMSHSCLCRTLCTVLLLCDTADFGIDPIASKYTAITADTNINTNALDFKRQHVCHDL